MTSDSQHKNEWMEYLRLVTPILVFIVGIYVASIDRRMETMSQQIFHHLTNDEIHSPKSIIVSKAEFQIYQTMRDSQMKDIRDAMKEVTDLLKTHAQIDERYYYEPEGRSGVRQRR